MQFTFHICDCTFNKQEWNQIQLRYTSCNTHAYTHNVDSNLFQMEATSGLKISNRPTSGPFLASLGTSGCDFSALWATNCPLAGGSPGTTGCTASGATKTLSSSLVARTDGWVFIAGGIFLAADVACPEIFFNDDFEAAKYQGLRICFTNGKITGRRMIAYPSVSEPC